MKKALLTTIASVAFTVSAASALKGDDLKFNRLTCGKSWEAFRYALLSDNAKDNPNCIKAGIEAARKGDQKGANHFPRKVEELRELYGDSFIEALNYYINEVFHISYDRKDSASSVQLGDKVEHRGETVDYIDMPHAYLLDVLRAGVVSDPHPTKQGLLNFMHALSNKNVDMKRMPSDGMLPALSPNSAFRFELFIRAYDSLGQLLHQYHEEASANGADPEEVHQKLRPIAEKIIETAEDLLHMYNAPEVHLNMKNKHAVRDIKEDYFKAMITHYKQEMKGITKASVKKDFDSQIKQINQELNEYGHLVKEGQDDAEKLMHAHQLTLTLQNAINLYKEHKKSPPRRFATELKKYEAMVKHLQEKIDGSHAS